MLHQTSKFWWNWHSYSKCLFNTIIDTCRCIGGHFPWIGALDDFFPRICFMTSFRWSSPSSRVVILFAVRGLLLSIGILESVFCRGMGDMKYFDILDVIFSNERNDVQFGTFGRVIISAYPIAGVWLGYLHILQQVS